MNVAKVRKAIVAGVGATLAAFVAGLANAPKDQSEWSALIGISVAAGVAAGWAVWRTPNSK